MTSFEFAALALDHFRYAGSLSAVFALVTALYLMLLWGVVRSLSRVQFLLVHTLYLLWQTNVAFVAVVALASGSRCREAAGEAMAGWNLAPLMVPSAALLYTSVLLLSLGIIWLRLRDPGHSGLS